MKLDEIDSQPKKMKMKNCRVYYVNVGNAPPSEVPKLISSYVDKMSESYDIEGVIFQATREHDSGWQFPT
jgi:hypothetical protein